jgi:hypothetical protein
VRRVPAVMATLLLMAGAQLVLLTVAVEGFLGGQPDLLGPAALGSGMCFAVTWTLIRRVHRS